MTAAALIRRRVAVVAAVALAGWASLAVAVPIISITKSVVTFSAPRQGTDNPKAIPGAVMNYTLIVTNTGPDPGEPEGIQITDPIPDNTQLFVGDIGGAGTGPVVFTDGAIASNLALDFVSLSSATDDLEFCAEANCTDSIGLDFGYVPTPDADGFDSAVTQIRITPSGTMAASAGPDPSFQLEFRVRVR